MKTHDTTMADATLKLAEAMSCFRLSMIELQRVLQTFAKKARPVHHREHPFALYFKPKHTKR